MTMKKKTPLMKKVYVTKKDKKEKGRNKYLTTTEAFN